MGFQFRVSPVEFAAFGIRKGDQKPNPRTRENPKSAVAVILWVLLNRPLTTFSDRNGRRDPSRGTARFGLSREPMHSAWQPEKTPVRVPVRSTRYSIFYMVHGSVRHSNPRDAHCWLIHVKNDN